MSLRLLLHSPAAGFPVIFPHPASNISLSAVYRTSEIEHPLPSVILTRSDEDNRAIAPYFGARGFVVHSVPMIELRPLPADQCGLRSVRRLAGGEPVLLTSAYAADLWLDLRETDFREHVPSGYYVVGRRSAALLRDGDPEVPVLAVADSGEELLRGSFQGVRRLLYPCSTERRDPLVNGLRGRGVDVVELPLYSPVIPAGSRLLLSETFAAAEAPVAIAFFSPSAVRNFFNLAPDIPRNTIFAAIGRTTAGALEERGIRDIVLPEHPDAEALAAILSRIVRGAA